MSRNRQRRWQRPLPYIPGCSAVLALHPNAHNFSRPYNAGPKLKDPRHPHQIDVDEGLTTV
jgi:hypothetical protein